MKSQDKDSKSKYEGYSDEELVYMLRSGDNDIMEYLLNKYKNLVRKKAASMHILGADDQDLIQEGMIGMFKAVRDFDRSKDAGFLTFAELCVSRQMYTAVTASRRQKHMPLNTYVSLSNGSDKDGEDEGPALEGRFSDNPLNNPESLLIDRENVEAIEHWIETALSGFERQCLELYLTGMNYSEIAKVLEKEEKATDNALNRAKNKLKKQFAIRRNE